MLKIILQIKNKNNKSNIKLLTDGVNPKFMNEFKKLNIGINSFEA